MNRTCSDPARRLRLFAVLVLAAFLPVGLLSADEFSARRAVELYDAASYAEARAILEQLDAAGEATGPLLYRLYYCQRATGDGALSNETLRRAVERLEQEMTERPDLEVGFYLATGYENLGRKDKALDVAAEILSEVEAGEIEAVTGVDRFRLGKLYADQGNEIEAANWYRSSIQAFGEEESGNAAYIGWASRYLADRALAMDDYSAAEIYLTTLIRVSRPSAEDLDRLAIARVRNEMFLEASDAWMKAVPLNPAQSNRFRYCAQLAAAAARLGDLPETAPSGKSWDDMMREEIESVLKEQAAVAREMKLAFLQQAEDIDDARRAEMQASLRDVRRVFVSAGLEYALQGYDIREAAFLGGYAPLVFQSREWKLVTDEERKERAAQRRAESEQQAEETKEGDD